MRSLRENCVILIASALVLGFPASVAFADLQARPKKDRSTSGHAVGREAPRAEVTDGTEVSLGFDRKFYQMGDTVRVTVRIERGENVGHVPFQLTYDPAVLRFEGGEEGGFLRVDDQGTVFLASSSTSGSAVVVGLSRLGRQVGVAGKGELCTLEFTVVGRGDARLAFTRASVRDPENRSMPAEFRAKPLVVR